MPSKLERFAGVYGGSHNGCSGDPRKVIEAETDTTSNLNFSVLYFGWPNQPSSGKVRNNRRARSYKYVKKYLRNSGAM